MGGVGLVGVLVERGGGGGCGEGWGWGLCRDRVSSSEVPSPLVWSMVGCLMELSCATSLVFLQGSPGGGPGGDLCLKPR